MKSDHIHKIDDRKKHGNSYLHLTKRNPQEKISILSDSMFKAMMFEHNRIKYSCKPLSYYLNISYEELLKTLRLGKNELDKSNERKKGERADYVAYYNDFCINIEINCNSNLETMERNREYRHRLGSKKIKIGENYTYTPVLQININDFVYDGKEKVKYICFLMDEEGDVESDKEIIINIYVPNLYKKWYTTGMENLTEDERFLLTLIEPNIEKAKELGKDNEIMEEFIKEAIDVSEEDDLLEAYDKEWALKDLGKQEGAFLKENEIVNHMYSLHYGVNTIVEMTGLSKEQVKDYLGENAREEDDLIEAYDKEWSLKDQEYHEGAKHGREEKESEIIKKMLEEKTDINFIMKVTGLSKRQVESYMN